jgi:AcrR family transcriptional regulator
MPRSAEVTRRAVIDAAYALLRRKGFSRLSLDEIAAAAAVTKRTLYHHFTSKDALIAAVLDAESRRDLRAFQTFGREMSGTPAAIVDQLFAELGKWASKPHWAGSGFTRIAVELVDLPGHPARGIARRHKAAMEALLAEMLAAAGLACAAERSREIYLVVEGAMAMMLVHGDPGYVAAAAEAAKRLISSPRVDNGMPRDPQPGQESPSI